jgi:Uma2 family endonuclease
MASSSSEVAMSTADLRRALEHYLSGEETLAPQELIWGRVRDAPSPAPTHQIAVGRFFRTLDAHVASRRLGVVIVAPMDCVLDHEQALVVQPDVLFVSAARAEIIRDRVRGAPDLVVEVLSPRPRIGTVAERLEWFERYGVRECWLYHQFARQLELFDWKVGSARHVRYEFDERIVSSVLPEFDLSCSTIASTI